MNRDDVLSMAMDAGISPPQEAHEFWICDPSDLERFAAHAERAEADAEIGRKWRADSSLETWFPYTAEELTRLRAELVAARVDAERYRELRRLATAWPQTVLVVNINIGHDWRTADAPEEIDRVVDAAIDAAGVEEMVEQAAYEGWHCGRGSDPNAGEISQRESDAIVREVMGRTA